MPQPRRTRPSHRSLTAVVCASAALLLIAACGGQSQSNDLSPSPAAVRKPSPAASAVAAASPVADQNAAAQNAAGVGTTGQAAGSQSTAAQSQAPGAAGQTPGGPAAAPAPAPAAAPAASPAVPPQPIAVRSLLPLTGEYAVTANLDDHSLSVVAIGAASVATTVQLNLAPGSVAAAPNSDTAVAADGSPDGHALA